MAGMVIKSAPAQIVAKDSDGSPTGEFEMILSTGTKDRDGEIVDQKSWRTLPERISVNVNHDMTVQSVIGSGVPTIENDQLVVRGSYASTALAQEVRTLVNEGHVTSTSVEFIRHNEPGDEKGVTRTSYELLGGAIVYAPANTDCMVFASKTLCANCAEKINPDETAEKATSADDEEAAAKAAAESDSADEQAMEEAALRVRAALIAAGIPTE